METKRGSWARFKSGDDPETDVMLEAIRLQVIKGWGRLSGVRAWPGFMFPKCERSLEEQVTHVYGRAIAAAYDAAARLAELEAAKVKRFDVTIAYPVYRWRRVEVEATDPDGAARAALALDDQEQVDGDTLYWEETESAGPTFAEFIYPADGTECIDYLAPDDCTEPGRNRPTKCRNGDCDGTALDLDRAHGSAHVIGWRCRACSGLTVALHGGPFVFFPEPEPTERV